MITSKCNSTKIYYCGAYRARIGSGRKKRIIPGCRRRCPGTKRKSGVILVKKRPGPIGCKCKCRSNNGIINIRDPGTFLC